MQKLKVAIVQPLIPHYRADFFKKLSEEMDLNLFVVRTPKPEEGFSVSQSNEIRWLKSFQIKEYIFFNIIPLITGKYDFVVLTPDPRWPTIILILLLKRLSGAKVVLWGHGVSVKHGFDPARLRDKVKLCLYNMADGFLFYTENELNMMKPYLKSVKLAYLNNTINIEKIMSTIFSPTFDKASLKSAYGISTPKVIIHSARFITERRPDLLVEFIRMMADEDITFIIVGDGVAKPNFETYENTIDFGALYDEKRKRELYAISDFYFQPAWCGLSVVEAMAHGLPVLTLKKSEEVLQCVEYGYIEHRYNGFIGYNLHDLKEFVLNSDAKTINKMKEQCLLYVKNSLRLSSMVSRFCTGLLETLQC